MENKLFENEIKEGEAVATEEAAAQETNDAFATEEINREQDDSWGSFSNTADQEEEKSDDGWGEDYLTPKEENAPKEKSSETKINENEENISFFKTAKWKKIWDKITTGLLIAVMAIPVAILAYILIWFLLK